MVLLFGDTCIGFFLKFVNNLTSYTSATTVSSMELWNNLGSNFTWVLASFFGLSWVRSTSTGGFWVCCCCWISGIGWLVSILLEDFFFLAILTYRRPKTVNTNHNKLEQLSCIIFKLMNSACTYCSPQSLHPRGLTNPSRRKCPHSEGWQRAEDVSVVQMDPAGDWVAPVSIPWKIQLLCYYHLSRQNVGHFCPSQLQRSAKRLVRGCEKFLPALA